MWVAPANGEQIAAVYSGGKFNKFGGTWTGKTTATEAVTTFKIGISIMDGPFPCIMPYSGKDLTLLYHVQHSVIATKVTKQVDQAWLKPETSPFRDMDKVAFFKNFKNVCAEYIPAIADTRLTGFLEGPRMVLAHHDDARRPSLINTQIGGRYITVFSGKVDHSLKIADDVTSILQKSL